MKKALLFLQKSKLRLKKTYWYVSKHWKYVSDAKKVFQTQKSHLKHFFCIWNILSMFWNLLSKFSAAKQVGGGSSISPVRNIHFIFFFCFFCPFFGIIRPLFRQQERYYFAKVGDLTVKGGLVNEFLKEDEQSFFAGKVLTGSLLQVRFLFYFLCRHVVLLIRNSSQNFHKYR